MRPKALMAALDFRLSELFKWDLVVGLACGAFGVWLALTHPESLDRAVTFAGSLVGVVIGAVVAGAAILGAFLDQSFLRKLRAIDKEPVRYFAPLLFTATLGVVAGFLLLALAVTPSTAPTWILATTAGLAGLAAGWTLASLIYDLDVLVQFLQLQDAAAQAKDPAASLGETTDPGSGQVHPLRKKDGESGSG